MIYVCYSPWHFCLYLQWKLVCIDGIICHRLVYKANYLTFSQTAFVCCQRKASMSDSFLQTTRCCSPSGWDLANVNAHQSFRCHMPPAGLMERRPAENWNGWRCFMTSGEDLFNIRELNSTLRTYNWMFFLPLATNENRRWIMRPRMNLVPEKCSPLWLTSRKPPSRCEPATLKLWYENRREWRSIKSSHPCEGMRSLSSANRDYGLTVWNWLSSALLLSGWGS